jgi:hypothetical protein
VADLSGTAVVRRRFEEAAARVLLGRTLLGVAYGDLPAAGDQSSDWDYGDWHHAVLGVDLVTDAGPACVTWTDTFFSYGVDVLAAPLGHLAGRGPEGPQIWPVTDHPYWQARGRQPIERLTVFWNHFTLGPGHTAEGRQAGAAQDEYQVPVAVRLDFSNGPVWLVAAIPQWPQMEQVFVTGDEIMVVFTTDRMRMIGFPDDPFIATHAT